MSCTCRIGLLRSDVPGCAHVHPHLSDHTLVVRLLIGSFSDAKIDDVWNSFLVNLRHHDGSRLEVAVNDCFLTGVLNAVTDSDKKL
jgi:hypothetical protein